MSNNRDGSHTVASEKKTMLFDAGSLTSLLKGNAAAKKKGTSHAGSGQPNMNDMITMILKQETGKAAKKSNVPKKKKKSKQAEKKSSLISRSLRMTGVSKSRANRMAGNNVFEYAIDMDLPRDEVIYLDQAYSRIKTIVDLGVTKLVLGFEQLNGEVAEDMSREDAALLIDFAGIDVDHSEISYVFAAPVVETHLDQQNAKNTNAVPSSPAAAAPEPPPNHEQNNTTNLSSTFSRVEENEEENGKDALKGVAEKNNDGQQVTEDQHGKGHGTNNKSDSNHSNSIKLNALLAAIRTHFRNRLMTLVIAENKGFSRHDTLGDYTSSNNNEVNSVTDFNDSIISTSGRQPPQADDSMSVLSEEGSADYQHQQPHHAHTISGEVEGRGAMNCVVHKKNVAFSTTDGSFLVSGGPVINSQPNSRPGSQQQRQQQQSDHQREMVRSKSQPGHTNRDQPSMHISPERSIYRDMDPTAASSMAGDDCSTAAGHQSTASRHHLPPVKLKQMKIMEKKKKALQKGGGYDSSLTRETPRILHYDAHGGGPGGGGGSTAENIAALRRELELAQEGERQLSKMVDTNIAWTQAHCDMGAAASHFSYRAKLKCQSMATERIVEAFDGHLDTTKMWVLNRWRKAVQFINMSMIAKGFARAKSIEILTNTTGEAVTRQYLKAWVPWLHGVQMMVVKERLAAAIEIQRVVRGKLGRIYFRNTKYNQAGVVLQCMVRRKLSRKKVDRARQTKQELHRANAANRMKEFFAGLVAMRKARQEVDRRRRIKAALKIQKIARGKAGRARFRFIASQPKPPASPSPIKTPSPNKKKAEPKKHSTARRSLFAPTAAQEAQKKADDEAKAALKSKEDAKKAKAKDADNKRLNHAKKKRAQSLNATRSDSRAALNAMSDVTANLAGDLSGGDDLGISRSGISSRERTSAPSSAQVSGRPTVLPSDATVSATSSTASKDESRPPSGSEKFVTSRPPSAAHLKIKTKFSADSGDAEDYEKKQSVEPEAKTSAKKQNNKENTTVERRQRLQTESAEMDSWRDPPGEAPDSLFSPVGELRSIQNKKSKKFKKKSKTKKAQNENALVSENSDCDSDADSICSDTSSVAAENYNKPPPGDNNASDGHSLLSDVSDKQLNTSAVTSSKSTVPSPRPTSGKTDPAHSNPNDDMNDADKFDDKNTNHPPASASKPGTSSSRFSRNSSPNTNNRSNASTPDDSKRSMTPLGKIRNALQGIFGSKPNTAEGGRGGRGSGKASGNASIKNSPGASRSVSPDQRQVQQQQQQPLSIDGTASPAAAHSSPLPSPEHSGQHMTSPPRSSKSARVQAVEASGSSSRPTTAALPNGDSYKGGWDATGSVKHGFGVYTYASGAVFEGSFVNGKMEGLGVYLFADGSLYIGDFHNDCRDGLGTYLYSTRAVYQGEWKDNAMCGEGIYQYKNGDIFQGSFQAGKKHGSGFYRANKDMALWKATFDMNKLVDKEKLEGSEVDCITITDAEGEEKKQKLFQISGLKRVGPAQWATATAVPPHGSTAVSSPSQQSSSHAPPRAWLESDKRLGIFRYSDPECADTFNADFCTVPNVSSLTYLRGDFESAFAASTSLDLNPLLDDNSAPPTFRTPPPTPPKVEEEEHSISVSVSVSVAPDGEDGGTRTDPVTKKKKKKVTEEQKRAHEKAKQKKEEAEAKRKAEEAQKHAELEARKHAHHDPRLVSHEKDKKPAAKPEMTHVQKRHFMAGRIQQLARARNASKKVKMARDRKQREQELAGAYLRWAVLQIQTVVRGKLGRKRFKNYADLVAANLAKKRYDAATRIQCMSRSRAARTRVGIMIRHKNEIDWLKSFQKEGERTAEERRRAKMYTQSLGNISSSQGGRKKDPVEEKEEREEASAASYVTSSSKPSSSQSTRSASGKPEPNKESTVDHDGDEYDDGIAVVSASVSVAPSAPGTARDSAPGSSQSIRGTRSVKAAAAQVEAEETAAKNTISSKGGSVGQSPMPSARGGESQQTKRGSDGNTSARSVREVDEESFMSIKLDEKLKQLQAIEQSIRAREESMMNAAKAAEEKAAAVQKALEEMERRSKAEEADRQARQELLAMAAGPIDTGRSDFQNTARSRGAQYLGTARGVPTPRTARDAPPTARSARGGAGVPPDAPRLSYKGQEWVQLFDPEQNSMYWYCAATQAAQWETPGSNIGSHSARGTSYTPRTARDAPPTARSARGGANIPNDAPRLTYKKQSWVQLWDPEQSSMYWYCEATGAAQWETPGSEYSYTIEEGSRPDTGATDSGYESAGAMTDYSTDGERYQDWSDSDYEGVNGAASAGSDAASAALGPTAWQEYWDEQAQAKYWYNPATGEASWTKPSDNMDSRSLGSASNNSSARGASSGVDGSARSLKVGPSGGMLDAPSVQTGEDAGDWISYLDDETGQEYWYNTKTGETSWA